MSYLLLLGQFLLSLVFLFAATGKLLSLEYFANTLLSSNLPKVLIQPTAILIPIAEMSIAAGLILSPTWLLPSTMIAAAGLLIIFTAWMIVVQTRGLRLRCGCFGAGSSEIGPRTIMRNVFLVVAAFGSGILSLTVSSPLPGPSLWMVMITLSLGISIMLLIAFQRAAPVLILSKKKLLKLQSSYSMK